MSTEWSIGAVFDAVAAAVPDRTMTVCGERRATFGETARRTRRFANFLGAKGFGAHIPRERLDRWECGQDRIALIMRNDRYLDVLLGCVQGRVVPMNVNYHYTRREIGDLLAYLRPRGIVYHRTFGPVVDETAPADVELLVGVDDGSGVADAAGAVDFDAVVNSGDVEPTSQTLPQTGPQTSPDDVIMLWVDAESDKLALIQDPDTPFFTSARFDGHPSVLVRGSQIGAGWDPHWHQPTDRFDTFSDDDFRGVFEPLEQLVPYGQCLASPVQRHRVLLRAGHAEEVRGHPRGDHQVVVRHRLTALEVDRLGGVVHGPYDALQEPEFLLL